LNRSALVLSVLAAVALAACGGSSSSPTQPGPQSPGPGPTATPRPSATPVPNPTAHLAPGPVERYTIKVHSIDVDGGGGQNFREPTQDREGRWTIRVGEFVQLDSSQKNGSNQLCQTQGLPGWTLDDGNSIVRRRDGQPNPFVLRIDAVAAGEVAVFASVDGVASNSLRLLVSRR
jgi:hypothetical protein